MVTALFIEPSSDVGNARFAEAGLPQRELAYKSPAARLRAAVCKEFVWNAPDPLTPAPVVIIQRGKAPRRPDGGHRAAGPEQEDRTLIVERIGAAERNADRRHAAKHAETARRRMGPSAATGERSASRDQRRFEIMLVRRIVSG
jgi:hypothetical protein